MNYLQAISIFIGVIIIIARAPLLFAPEATLRLTREFVSNRGNIRMLGAFLIFFGLGTAVVAWDSAQLYSLLFLVLGLLMFIVGLMEVLVPAAVQKVAIEVWGMSVKTAQILGALAVLVGMLFLYLGFVVF
ncbi:hypothetical protein VDG1235_4041 [Verrucomicrobiia bacterium DG1235]|nr:hypothetical protein VDG1235_4041 [Verrucomicrobiae bacterium DG1235]